MRGLRKRSASGGPLELPGYLSSGLPRAARPSGRFECRQNAPEAEGGFLVATTQRETTCFNQRPLRGHQRWLNLAALQPRA